MRPPQDSRSWTVYFVGAGFAKACLPDGNEDQPVLLSKLMPAIFERIADYPQLNCFCTEVFGTVDGFSHPSIQDVFTVIDAALDSGSSVGRFDPQNLARIRDELCQAVSQRLKTSLERCKRSLVRSFGELVKERHDRTTVITTNWDILLDQALRVERDGKQCVWYGVDSHSYEDHDRWIPYREGLERDWALSRLLKLHGSANWLWCRACGRLYVTYDRKGVLDYYANHEACRCTYCADQADAIDEGDSFRLRPLMLMPTFLQNYEQRHISAIWHRAMKELRRAARIVILGYSLPSEDYYVRNLFARALASRSADVPEIKVVLCEADKEDGTADRYQKFFGERLTEGDISFEGIETWLM